MQDVICDVFCLRFHVPEFIKVENWLPKSPNVNSMDYSV